VKTVGLLSRESHGWNSLLKVSSSLPQSGMPVDLCHEHNPVRCSFLHKRYSRNFRRRVRPHLRVIRKVLCRAVRYHQSLSMDTKQKHTQVPVLGLGYGYFLVTIKIFYSRNYKESLIMIIVASLYRPWLQHVLRRVWGKSHSILLCSLSGPR
jgi:hypothetical protein